MHKLVVINIFYYFLLIVVLVQSHIQNVFFDAVEKNYQHRDT